MNLEQLQKSFSSNCGNSRKYYAISTTLPFVVYNYKYGSSLIVNNNIKICQRKIWKAVSQTIFVLKKICGSLANFGLTFPQKVGCSVLFSFLSIKWWEARGSTGSISACQIQQQPFSTFLREHTSTGLWNHLTDKLNFALLCNLEFFRDTSETSC